jgi:hypothetical protein
MPKWQNEHTEIEKKKIVFNSEKGKRKNWREEKLYL